MRPAGAPLTDACSVTMINFRYGSPAGVALYL
jgi:hypothetical protein